MSDPQSPEPMHHVVAPSLESVAASFAGRGDGRETSDSMKSGSPLMDLANNRFRGNLIGNVRDYIVNPSKFYYRRATRAGHG